ncbi:MAG: methyltransferase domain-containing protein [Pirellulales bacterium]|nr:methyltransferase domain-containing protein [Pirellulales bacterium]
MRRILSFLAITAVLVLTSWEAADAAAPSSKKDAKSVRGPDCVYVGTPYDVIDKMLDLASIRKTDVVYDLGCGDGRIVVAAARRFGCRGVGYDIDPQRIQEALENVDRNRVKGLVGIEQEDIFTLDLGRADVIMLYLLPSMNKRLIPQLAKLKPGSRIVAHNYDIEGIAREESVTFRSLEDGVNHYIYVYTAPLKKKDATEP